MTTLRRPDLDAVGRALAQLTGPVSISFRDGRVASNDISELVAYTIALEAAARDVVDADGSYVTLEALAGVLDAEASA